MADDSYVWDSRFEGKDVRKSVYFVAHGDIGFGVNRSGERVGGMALQHVSGVHMFYVLSAYLNSRERDVPALDFGGLEGCVDSEQDGQAVELLEDHRRYLSHEYVLFERYSPDVISMFSLSGSGYSVSYSAYSTDDNDLGFICKERNKNLRFFDSNFCMTFSEEDSIEAIKGMIHVYREGDIGVVLAGFKRITDYFGKNP